MMAETPPPLPPNMVPQWLPPPPPNNNNNNNNSAAAAAMNHGPRNEQQPPPSRQQQQQQQQQQRMMAQRCATEAQVVMVVVEQQETCLENEQQGNCDESNNNNTDRPRCRNKKTVVVDETRNQTYEPSYCGWNSDDDAACSSSWFTAQDFVLFKACTLETCKQVIRRDRNKGSGYSLYRQSVEELYQWCCTTPTPLQQDDENKEEQAVCDVVLPSDLRDRLQLCLPLSVHRLGLERNTLRSLLRDKADRRRRLVEHVRTTQQQLANTTCATATDATAAATAPTDGRPHKATTTTTREEFLGQSCARLSRPSRLFAQHLAQFLQHERQHERQYERQQQQQQADGGKQDKSESKHQQPQLQQDEEKEEDCSGASAVAVCQRRFITI